MKVCITGHTKGIGQSLTTIFDSNHHQIIGFSRSNGYDINNFTIRESIIAQSLDADIFINNAYDAVGQTELLKTLINKWEGTDKLIVNISSKLAYYPLGSENGEYDDYIKAKSEQNAIIKSKIFTCSPNILNVITGLVDTEMSAIFKSDHKILPMGLAMLIYDVIKYKNIVSIQEIVVDAPGLDWHNIERNK
jgi:short-subunit dehydrogenase involved in D-alanine esterification of teichoic acids